MKDLASAMMGAMMMLIGLTLAFTILFLAITTVIHSNTKTIAMMRVFGYSHFGRLSADGVDRFCDRHDLSIRIVANDD